MSLELKPYTAGGGRVRSLSPGAWELMAPAGAATYRLAQLDDYAQRRRSQFLHRPPLHLSLWARASSGTVPGTWGFGLWNDPFGYSLTVRGSGRRLPTLPQAAWFFYASPANFLSFRDDKPAQGFLAATFASLPWSGFLSLLAAPLAPALLLPPLARLLRRLARVAIHEDSTALSVDPTLRHRYSLRWLPEGVTFAVDDAVVLEAPVSPRGPLGLVLWVDNQYAAFPPNGRLRFGSLAAAEPATLELGDLLLDSASG